MWHLSFQPSVMMVNLVPDQQTLNCTISYQNMLIIFITFFINIINLLTKILFYFYDIVAYEGQVQRFCGSFVAHLWVHISE
ncbi:hypothetical protein AMTRI_Chr05g61670 [Amborella trichopoda]